MEISEREVRELHTEPRTSRRTLLWRAGALTIGTAVVPLARLLPASAQTATEQELTDADIAAFAESIELAAVEAYRAAGASGKLSAPALATVNTFLAHHQEHATALGTAAGNASEGKPNAKLLTTLIDQLRNAPDEKAALQIAFDLETAAAATQLFALGALQSDDGLKLAASILPVESQHAVVIGQALGKAIADIVPNFENQSRAVDMEKFPTTPTTSTTTSTTTK